MKAIKVSDELYDRIMEEKGKATFNEYVQGLVDQPETQQAYDPQADYVGDLLKQVEALVVENQRLVQALDGAIQRKAQAQTQAPKPAPQQEAVIADRVNHYEEARSLEAERDEELSYCQDPETRQEITRKYKALIDEQWELHHQSKNRG